LILITGIEEAVNLGLDLTILGDGELFWEIADRYGDHVAILNYVPCHSVQNVIQQFDVVISSGRGVMEALACGIPTICAGVGYAGLVNGENVESLLRYNLTGAHLGNRCSLLGQDLACAGEIAPNDCRKIATQFFNAEEMVGGFVAMLEETVSCSEAVPTHVEAEFLSRRAAERPFPSQEVPV
jgi:glycosyltransferase involved in cell wall biosynthesis